jgi:N-acetylglucosaminyldiphosphoundecaprenol N-acetyl-beta-D-mannosaminyltransferase
MVIARTNILGVGVSAVNMDLAVSAIEGWIQRREPHYVCVANVHTITECQQNPDFRLIHNQAGMVTPDGMPLVWVSRLKGARQVKRVYGPDLLLAVSEVSARQGYRQYFYGGAEGVAARLANQLTARYPGLQVAGLESPPFRPLTEAEDDAAVARINAACPDIVWVGLGAPKQERWMAAHFGRLTAPVIISVGAAFDFHAGVKKQAPRWMQRAGLEWLHRLASEPRRLWKRYFINNPWFVWLVLLQLSGLKRYELEDK